MNYNFIPLQKVFFLSLEAKTLAVLFFEKNFSVTFSSFLIENFSHSAKRISDCRISYQPPSLSPFKVKNGLNPIQWRIRMFFSNPSLIFLIKFPWPRIRKSISDEALTCHTVGVLEQQLKWLRIIRRRITMRQLYLCLGLRNSHRGTILFWLQKFYWTNFSRVEGKQISKLTKHPSSWLAASYFLVSPDSPGRVVSAWYWCSGRFFWRYLAKLGNSHSFGWPWPCWDDTRNYPSLLEEPKQTKH